MEHRNSPILKMNLCREEEDRISRLPKSVLVLILSFLNLKQAIRTSILATKWRYVWKSLPLLDFNVNLLSDSPKYRKAHGFRKIVTYTLLYRERFSDLQGFRLDCSFLDKYDPLENSYINKWIVYAVRRNIQELYLSLSTFEEQFRLPGCLFSSESLIKFEFRLASDLPFPFKLKLPEFMSLPSLKTLILHGVPFQGDYDILNKIFSRCPVLESLTISHCEFSRRDIDINAPNLKHLVIENLYYRGVCDTRGYNIKLNAPNLVSFRCDCEDFMSNEYSVEKNLSALVRADVDMKIE